MRTPSTRKKTVSILKRIRAEKRLNAFIRTFDKEAISCAKQVDRGVEGRLAGLLVAVKDNIAVAGKPLTCASRILEGHISPYDATVVSRLRDAGAILLGMTNMDEFAMGSSTETSVYGPTLNPLDPERVPGGSSGGSAAAVAAGLCDAALGSDTGGSVRQPAAFCGVVGYKPTYGRVSRHGLVAFASSLDQVGVFARDVATVARVAREIAGHDPADATSSPHPVPDYEATLEQGIRGKTVGVPVDYMPGDLDESVRAAVDAARVTLERAGATCVEVSLPHTKFVIPCYYTVANAEASSNLARYDGGRYGRRVGDTDDLLEMLVRTRSEGFGTEVKRRILLGTYVLSSGYRDEYYGHAMRVRRIIRDEMHDLFRGDINLLLTPTAPTPAFRLGERSDPIEMYRSDVYTAAMNLAGVPAVSVPGRTTGLPVGVQLVAAPFDEELLFRAARVLERDGSVL